MSFSSFEQLNLDSYYTYQDYLTWTFPERVELFLGRVLRMSPAPNRTHQKLSGNIFVALSIYLKNSKCETYSAPFDVRLPISLKKGKSDTVVQPDIVVICDRRKLDKQGCNGAPDIVIEILSPGNSKREMKDKFELYEASLVKEYWIVDPVHQDVTIYTLTQKNKYIGSRPYLAGHSIPSSVLEGFSIEASEVFRE